MRPRTITAVLLWTAALVAGALACSDSSGPRQTVPPPPPPPPTSFAIRPALDTALIREYVLFVAERPDSTVDQWTVSDSSLARLIPMERGRALLVARLPGTVTITARRQGDSGQATLIIPPFAIQPALDTVTIGQLVTYQANQWAYDSIQWSIRDSSFATLDEHQQYWARVVGRAGGAVTITASHQGDTAHATLVIREPQAGEWEAIDLGRLDADGAAARAINDDGTIVGWLGGPGSAVRGFIYKDGTMHTLATSGGRDAAEAIGPSGQIGGIAYDDSGQAIVWASPDVAPSGLDKRIEAIIGINDPGDLLITTWFGNYKYSPHYRGVLWRANGRVDLGDLSDSTVANPSTYAKAWNRRGQIVGWSDVRDVPHTDNQDPTSVSHPFLWEKGAMRDLGVLAPLPCTQVAMAADCSWGEAVDINASGVVVGTATGADGKRRAFIWENGILRDLGVYPGRDTRAIAINDRGQILGRVDGASFLWENGQAQIVPGVYAMALGANGEVVGLGRHTVVWEAGRLTDLGEADASAINSRGEIVGSSGRRAMLWRKRRA